MHQFAENIPLLPGSTAVREKDWDRELRQTPRIAVQIHLYYPDLIGEILSNLALLRYPFDLYITSDCEDKAVQIRQGFAPFLAGDSFCRSLHIDVFENRGRDVIPFLKQMRGVYGNYKYICHLHTKKSLFSEIGDDWRHSLYAHLFGSEANVDDILYRMETEASVGVICPCPHYIFSRLGLDGNYSLLCELSRRLGMGEDFFAPLQKDDLMLFPAGNMFWAKCDAVRQLLAFAFSDDEIPREEGQLDGTILHAMERIWCYLAEFNGYKTVIQANEDFMRQEIRNLHEACMQLQEAASPSYRVNAQLLEEMNLLQRVNAQLLEETGVLYSNSYRVFAWFLRIINRVFPPNSIIRRIAKRLVKNNEAPHILLLYAHMIPSIILCGHSQMTQLSRMERIQYRSRCIQELSQEDLMWSDTVLLGRLDSAEHYALAQELKKAGKQLIYILDDDLLNVPDSCGSSAHYARPEVKELIGGLLALCDGILSPSLELLKKYVRDGQQALLVEEPALLPGTYEPRERDYVSIGFAGSMDRTKDLEVLLKDALMQVHARYGEKVRFEFFGAIPEFAKDLDALCIPYQNSYEEYLSMLHERAWDIGLAPMPDSAFHRCKHYIKYIEYASCGTVGVFSELMPYTRIAGKYGGAVFCENTAEAWRDTLCRLIDDRVFREQQRKLLCEEAAGKLNEEAVALFFHARFSHILRYRAPKASVRKCRRPADGKGNSRIS